MLIMIGENCGNKNELNLDCFVFFWTEKDRPEEEEQSGQDLPIGLGLGTHIFRECNKLSLSNFFVSENYIDLIYLQCQVHSAAV